VGLHRDIEATSGATRERVMSGSKVIETKCGPIEYAAGEKVLPCLWVHGAGGGYDQGLWISRII